MELEELTKSQIVLLTLMVSFVTSIATGIVTVSLMEQTPPAITQTIQKVVERTIERVIPDEKKVVEKKVVTGESVLVGVIEENSKSLVRISRKSQDEDKLIFVGLGFVVSKDGVVVTDSNFINFGGSYFATLSNSSVVSLEIVSIKTEKNIAIMKVSSKDGVSYTPVKFGNSDLLRLGQDAITITGERSDEVLTGIFSNFIKTKIVVEKENENKEDAVQKSINQIKTNISFKNNISGGPLINLSGEVIGINIITPNEDFVIPANEIIKVISL